MDEELDFDVTVTSKEIKDKLDINIKSKKDGSMQNQRSAIVTFNGYKNLLYNQGISFCTHEGKYAINIKSYINYSSIPDCDLDKAYSMCQNKFFQMALVSANEFGFDSIETSGRSDGYIIPLESVYNEIKPIYAVHSQRLSFLDYIKQQKVEAYAAFIKENLYNIQMFYKYSKNIEELSNLLMKSSTGDFI